DSPLSDLAVSKAPEAPLKITPELIQEVTDNLASGVKDMEELRKQVDALPAQIKKERSADIDMMYTTLEGMIEKQTGMLNEIKAANTPTAANATQESGGAAGPNADQLKDYIESANRYAEEAKGIQDAVQKMADPAKN
ncbi:MAG: hypothetical protein Q7T20_11145, partial [Saprospiraceae bacterium]|nr:hypothetical protein [Saprospiraceae bacterium]